MPHKNNKYVNFKHACSTYSQHKLKKVLSRDYISLKINYLEESYRGECIKNRITKVLVILYMRDMYDIFILLLERVIKHNNTNCITIDSISDRHIPTKSIIKNIAKIICRNGKVEYYNYVITKYTHLDISKHLFISCKYNQTQLVLFILKNLQHKISFRKFKYRQTLNYNDKKHEMNALDGICLNNNDLLFNKIIKIIPNDMINFDNDCTRKYIENYNLDLVLQYAKDNRYLLCLYCKTIIKSYIT